MNTTISRPVQIFALVAVIAALGGGAMLMLKPKQAVAPPVVASRPATAATTSTAPSRTTTTARATHHPAASRSVPPTSRQHETPKPAASPVGKNGLPTVVDSAFRSHKIVVVSVFNPQSSTDAISYAEARAGASVAGVGFVGVSLLDSPLAAALTSSLPGGGLLPAPGLLIYRKPGVLVQLIDGFADRDVVAQAAAAGATAQPVTGTGS